ncbi:adenylate/guanylate cyclase domain-containing protein [Phaeobacter sp. LSS9]|uniref:adenylate/guanylate cyclase domain-containing protein n=2 Tax=unclassified Phaeobacter TaxID=2621772 RepID=UPI000E4E4D91|nr:adenylate/guanylate cyclase domain-containing protein [Phaeobacter sp. LSS9]AXT35487.1 adenylate/guanylate cyclase domain-containing protein [Phaeobacter sp. LSS9]
MQQTTIAPLLTNASIAAERLVSVLRIAVTLGLFTVFAVTVAGLDFSTLAPFLHRQLLFAVLTMFAYLILGVVTFAATTIGWFRPWMSWFSVTADCGFLLFNVWFSLENSNYPGGVALLLPPAWLVPLVLAYGVMRMDPRLQLYTTVLLSGGLGALIFWPDDRLDAGQLGILHSVLDTPANVMKLTMILLAGLVMVLAAARMRRLFYRELEAADARANLTRYLPAQVADQLADGGLSALQQGQRQPMAVMFVDIRGFTQWSETRDPQEVGDFITAFRNEVEDSAARHDGMIDKYMGDAAMLLFDDAPVAMGGPNGAARALACAATLCEAVHRWSDRRVAAGEPVVEIGIGVHAGEVFSGVVGNAARLEYSVFGDAVNTASRLEQHSKTVPQVIIASAVTLTVAGVEPARQRWVSLPPVTLRGRSKVIEIYGREG